MTKKFFLVESLEFFIKGSNNSPNNFVKSLLFGFIVGAFFIFGVETSIIKCHIVSPMQ